MANDINPVQDTSNLPKEIAGKEVEYLEADKLLDKLYGHETRIHGLYKYEPEIGDFVENQLLPVVYNRYVEKKRKSKDRSKLYNPHGKYNQFPLFILDLQSKSVILEAALDTTAKSARGQGSKIITDDDKIKKDFRKWLKDRNINKSFEKTLFLNLATNKGTFIELNFNSTADDSGATLEDLKSAKVAHFKDYRVGRENKFGEVERYWYHPNWYHKRVDPRKLRGISKYKSAEDALKRYAEVTVVDQTETEGFFTEDNQKAFNLGRFVYHLKEDNLRSEHYSLPSYITETAINSIFMNAAISQIDIAAVENGLTVAYFISIPLQKPRGDNKKALEKYVEKQQEYLDYINANFQGPENANTFAVLFSDPKSKNEPIHIAEVPNNNTAEVLGGKDERQERAQLIAFRAKSSALFGIPQRSGKGLNSQKGLLPEADAQWYEDFVVDFAELGEELYEEVFIPLYKKARNLPEDTVLSVKFPRKKRYKNIPSDELLLAAFPTRIIWDLYGIGDFGESEREELNRDLAERGINAIKSKNTKSSIESETD